MPIHVDLNTELRLKRVTFSGQITEAEFGSYSQSLSRDNRETHDVVFIDLSQLESLGFGYDQIWSHASRVSGRGKSRFVFSEVILAPSDAGFGMARMYASLVAKHIAVSVFRDATKAGQALAELIASRADVGETVSND